MKFIKDTPRYRLYFNKYRFRAIIRLDNIHYFRQVTSLKGIKQYISFVTERTPPKKIDYKKIKKYIFWVEQNLENSTIKRVISSNTITLYSDDQQLLVDTCAKFCDVETDVNFYYITPTTLQYDTSKIYQKNPKHKFRVFLKGNVKVIDSIIKFTNTYKCYPNSTLLQKIDLVRMKFHLSPFLSLYNTYIDFDDEETILLFNLCNPNTIRKTVPIDKR